MPRPRPAAAQSGTHSRARRRRSATASHARLATEFASASADHATQPPPQSHFILPASFPPIHIPACLYPSGPNEGVSAAAARLRTLSLQLAPAPCAAPAGGASFFANVTQVTPRV